MRHPVVAAILGLVVGMLVVMGIEALSHILYPLPFTPTLENLQEYTSQIPLGGMLLVLLAHFLGGIVAIFTTLKLSKKNLPAYIIAVVFFAATTYNLFLIPHPFWFTITDVVLTIIGMLIVFKLVKVKPKKTTA
ncbi:MAG: hypothetical protein P1U41_06685 [Vicingaceae bacterium]|nr:hypothetical protein [Vicingaceae bacterium]